MIRIYTEVEYSRVSRMLELFTLELQSTFNLTDRLEKPDNESKIE